jgi:hypothetical protein
MFFISLSPSYFVSDTPIACDVAAGWPAVFVFSTPRVANRFTAAGAGADLSARANLWNESVGGKDSVVS